jgi:hypothetical protein
VPDCSSFDSFFRVGVLDVELTQESASVRFALTATSLGEGTYPFTMHFPANDNKTWTYVPIGGSYTLTAVADATQSTASLCQNATCPPAQFISANGGTPPVVVKIEAKDVDGIAILRAGEALTVSVRQPDGSQLSLKAAFDAQNTTYEATIPGLIQAGIHRVLLATLLATEPFEVTNFTLVCAPGYAPDPIMQIECVPKQSECADDEYRDIDGTCNGQPTMGVAAVSTKLRLLLKKRCAVQVGGA